MKWILTISFCLLACFANSQVYHETKQGDVRILTADSTDVIVAFNTSEYIDVTSDYQHMRGLRGMKCYKYGWEVVEGGRIDHKGLFVVKKQDDSIYAVWYYEDTEDGRGRLSALLKKSFDY